MSDKKIKWVPNSQEYVFVKQTDAKPGKLIIGTFGNNNIVQEFDVGGSASAGVNSVNSLQGDITLSSVSSSLTISSIGQSIIFSSTAIAGGDTVSSLNYDSSTSILTLTTDQSSFTTTIQSGSGGQPTNITSTNESVNISGSGTYNVDIGVDYDTIWRAVYSPSSLTTDLINYEVGMSIVGPITIVFPETFSSVNLSTDWGNYTTPSTTELFNIYQTTAKNARVYYNDTVGHETNNYITNNTGFANDWTATTASNNTITWTKATRTLTYSGNVIVNTHYFNVSSETGIMLTTNTITQIEYTLNQDIHTLVEKDNQLEGRIDEIEAEYLVKNISSAGGTITITNNDGVFNLEANAGGSTNIVNTDNNLSVSSTSSSTTINFNPDGISTDRLSTKEGHPIISIDDGNNYIAAPGGGAGLVLNAGSTYLTLNSDYGDLGISITSDMVVMEHPSGFTLAIDNEGPKVNGSIIASQPWVSSMFDQWISNYATQDYVSSYVASHHTNYYSHNIVFTDVAGEVSTRIQNTTSSLATYTNIYNFLSSNSFNNVSSIFLASGYVTIDSVQYSVTGIYAANDIIYAATEQGGVSLANVMSDKVIHLGGDWS